MQIREGLAEEIIEKWSKKYKFKYVKETSFVYIGGNTVYLDSRARLFKKEIEYIFDILHEIGHLETNTNRMTRQKQEFLATTWAIGEFKKYNLNVSDDERESWQEYIDSFGGRKKSYIIDWSLLDELDDVKYELKKSKHTKTGETIYLVRWNETLSKERYIKLNRAIKTIGGYYSKFVHAFVFYDDPTESMKTVTI